MNFRISHPFEPGDKGGDEAARKEDPAKVRARVDEPIAIVGIACRFPGGATSPDRFWQLLWEGVDAIREVPADRWDIDAFYDPDRTAPGKMSTRWGGFLEGGVDGFDPGFFGISPREAVEMDPQQRLMLELAWEGFEDAGVDPASLRGSPVGVFAGAMWTEYARSVEGGAELISQHTATGQDSSIIPARISYTFGLSGPSLTVNTAASSSLVAIELACQSIRAGVSAAALAGGVNLILAPHSTVAMSKFGAMAPDGRCKAFDARANGYVRGEGGGLVLLKPLSRALADGDRIYCVIRGGALNNDGASSSLTAPSPEAQEAMLRAACANAGVEPAEVSYVEAHGTGTKVGDPIEAGALGAVIGAARKKGKGPLRVGSVKTNIGHLEAAAGVAGLIKVALSMDRGAIPASLHFETPNPSIDFEGLGVLVSARRGPWPEGRRVAGVSSFGFGGTNCHLVVEEAPRIAVRAGEEVDRPLHVVAISGHDKGALLDRAQALRGHLEADSSRSLADVGYSANARRGHLRERLAVVAGDAGEAAEALGVFLGGEGDARVIEGPREGLDRPPRVAFVFPGQGPQHAGMGRELYETQPVFREALDRCAAILKDLLPRPILPVMHPEEGDDPSIIDDTRYTQPALFAMGYALVELWRSWGIEPAAVLGHSMGELTAAHVAGVFSLEDGLKLAVARGHWMNEMPAGGRMVFVRASERRVAELVAPLADKVALAAINGPEHTVVSGAGEAVGVIVEALRAEGVETTEIRVSLASHSPLVAPVADAYGEAIKGILYGPPKLPLISNVTGAQADVRVAAPGYWVDHLRLPVRFGDGMAALNALGIDAVIEMSPHPVLLGMGREAGRAEGVRLWLPSLRRGSPDWSILLKSAAMLYTHGARIDWRAFDAPYARRLVDLPAYPFQRERFWLNGGRVRAWAGGAVPEAEGRGAAPSGTKTKKRSETLAEKLAKVEPEKRRDWVEQVIRAAAGKVVGLAAARIRTDRPWRELGLDSLMASELRGAVALLLGKSVPSTLMFDHPTVLSLTGYVLREVESLPAPEIVAESAPVSVPVSAPAPVSVPVPAPVPVPVPVDPTAVEPIAIVGMACRFPGDVNEPEQLAALLARGADAITDIPRERWDADALFSPDPGATGKIASRRGGFINKIDYFDAAFFGVTPAEARSMDPHQRLLLEISLEALERAGEVRERLAESDTGVFVGISSSDFEARTLPTARSMPPDPYGSAGRMRSGTAGRLSYWLGLRGPSMAVDTACSSALASIHLACQSLRARECDRALAGAVHLMLASENAIWLSQAGGLSPTGRCRSFDASADGYVLSEGCGVVVLKRLADAEAAGDPILAVIRGSAVNHGGQSNGFTAPSGPAQRALLRRALEQAKLPPSAVRYVEAHGTGTRMGDAIEARALADELGQGRSAGDPLLIGSIKPALGHTQAAAGIAGVVNVVLAFGREEIPPTLHFETPSPDVPWNELPLRVVTAATPWRRHPSVRRVAGVSAFGMTGMNAHVILEEPPPRARRAPPREGSRVLVPVSARTEALLRQAVKRLRDWVLAHPEVALHDIAYTAAVRRSHSPARAGFLAADGPSLGRALETFLAGDPSDAVITPDAAPLSSGGDALVDAALRFAAGEPVDFCALFPEGGEVVDLPTSPLDRRRFWIDAADAVSPEHSPHLVSPSRAGLAHALAGVDEGARVAELSAFLREQVGEMLHLHPPDVPDDVEWVGLGIDSLRATELSNRVRAALGLNIPSKTVFEHATLRKLAAHLAGLPISPGSRASGPPGEASAPDSFEEGLV